MYIGWTQKHSLISSSYKIKTHWNIFINIELQILHWHVAARTFLQRTLAEQMDWPRWAKWPGVLQVATEITGPDRLWLFPLGIREGQSLCTSTARNRGWAAGTHYRSCQVGHAEYGVESVARTRLSHRCLPSNKRGAHWLCVIPHETVWFYATVVTNFVGIFN